MMENQNGAAGAPSDARVHRFEFHGTGKEYFRIWIVNILLSIVTLGIYSAWAKVRSLRYLYRGVTLAGSSFDYHGDPVAILKGRIIAILIIAALNISQQINMVLYLVVLVLFLVVLPWLVTKSLAFRLRNSSWRGIRFSFRGTIGGAVECIYAYGLLTMFTFWIAYPVQFRRIREFFVNNAWFGDTRFSLTMPLRAVYTIFVLVGLMGGAGIIAVVLPLIKSFRSIHIPGTPPGTAVIFLLLPFFYLFLILVAYPFYKAKMSNLLWNGTALGNSTFQSNLTVFGYMKVLAINFLLTLLTLGFYWPWAYVNIVRYRVDNLSLLARDDLDSFTAGTSTEVGAAGEEVTSAFDFDISL